MFLYHVVHYDATTEQEETLYGVAPGSNFIEAMEYVVNYYGEDELDDVTLVPYSANVAEISQEIFTQLKDNRIF